MDALNEAIGNVNDVFWTYLVIPLLALVGIYFTVRSRAVQVRLLPDMIRNFGSSPERAPDGKKAISSFQAFAISAAARVGTGNIAGVAIAIAIGGPGAVFWMWLMGMVMGSAAFVESTLAQLYKVQDKTGYRGGPAYYMQHGLRARWMGVIFAVVIIFTFGFSFIMVQSHSITAAIRNSVSTATGQPAAGWVAPLVGGALVVLVAVVIFGGVRRIAHVAQMTVPFMALIYLILGIVVVVLNIEQVPTVLGDIVGAAFGLREIGAAGVGTAIMMGIRRGLFSNEAGMGSAPNAGATASVSHPVKQGLVQTFGVYFDTLIVCSITAFIILVSNPVYGEEMGARLTQNALEANLGSWSLHLLTLIIFLLAFTSVLGNFYYSEANLYFLTGSRKALTALRLVITGMLFLGAVASLDVVWSVADVTMGVMAVVNMVAIAPLGALTLRLLKDYQEQRRQGLDPVFTRDRMPDLRGVQCWESDRTQDVAARP
ncbi:alanine or glycine:cation symporter, AGCS family [Amycolatopsis arida]|uniref:Alanine or glycine:cation symporter, AGCS family n=1 Tax=Amycolatopsis arida TaxID=587909 RepID=A0A1I5Q5E2_9PSEU|nr:alanine/glycine:cation symporter family protein [Amycolatopsis arida]TDX98724.1 AGCS family alanine or glycine:cation symporter [Amycolatopsis arida]SFP41455.1 alanine or glycine:cation symporter, AGCS family [Amycolatopsis arida]